MTSTVEKKKRVLVVDDTPNNVQILGKILVDHYQVEVALNGTEAIDIINREDFDIILLDIMMPDVDGYEVCRQIRDNSRNKSTPVLFLTAKNDRDSVVKGLSLGAQDYIVKPFEKELILERLDEHLSSRSPDDPGQQLETQASTLLIEANNTAVREVVAARMLATQERMAQLSAEIDTILEDQEGLRTLLEKNVALTKLLIAESVTQSDIHSQFLSSLISELRRLDSDSGVFGVLRSLSQRLQEEGDSLSQYGENLSVVLPGGSSVFRLGREINRLLDAPNNNFSDLNLSGEFFDTHDIRGDRSFISILFNLFIAHSFMNSNQLGNPSRIETRTWCTEDSVFWSWQDNRRHMKPPDIQEVPFHRGSTGADNSIHILINRLIQEHFNGIVEYASKNNGELEVSIQIPVAG